MLRGEDEQVVRWYNSHKYNDNEFEQKRCRMQLLVCFSEVVVAKKVRRRRTETSDIRAMSVDFPISTLPSPVAVGVEITRGRKL